MSSPHAATRLEAFAKFCGNLRLEDGEPFELEDFQFRLLLDYFAGVVETLVLLSKKNGKTTLLAALALYHLITTRDAECVIGAASRDQAGILFKQANGFVRRSPGLGECVDPKPGYRELRSKADAGVIRVLAADVDTADGVIPTLALVDELHRHRDAGLYGVFRDGLGPRDGQMLTISTAGDNEASALGVLRASARHLPLVVTREEGRYVYARSADSSFAMHEWALERRGRRRRHRAREAGEPVVVADDREAAQPPRLAVDAAVAVAPVRVRRLGGRRSVVDGAGRLAGQRLRRARLEAGDRIALGFDGSRYGDATALVALPPRRRPGRAARGVGVPELAAAEDWEVPAGEVDAAMARAMEQLQGRARLLRPAALAVRDRRAGRWSTARRP